MAAPVTTAQDAFWATMPSTIKSLGDLSDAQYQQLQQAMAQDSGASNAAAGVSTTPLTQANIDAMVAAGTAQYNPANNQYTTVSDGSRPGQFGGDVLTPGMIPSQSAFGSNQALQASDQAQLAANKAMLANHGGPIAKGLEGLTKSLAIGGAAGGILSAYSPFVSGLTGFAPSGAESGMSAGSAYAGSGGIVPDWAGSGQTSALDALGTSGGSTSLGYSGPGVGSIAGQGITGAADASLSLPGASVAGTYALPTAEALGGGAAASGGLFGQGGVLGTGLSAQNALNGVTAAGALGTLASSLSSPNLGAGGQQNTGASGYNALPASAQNAYNGMATNASNLILGNPAAGAAMYTPIPLTAGEQTARQLSQPMTQQGVADMSATYMNPFTNSLMQTIANNTQGQNSVYQGQVSGSGFAPGTTNRDFLNEGYLQGQEQLAMGNTLAGQYQNSLNTGLTQQQLEIQNLTNQGAMQRQLGLQTAQAPMTALQALGQTTGLIPATTTSQGTTTPNTGTQAASLAQTATTLGNSLFGSGGFFGNNG